MTTTTLETSHQSEGGKLIYQTGELQKQDLNNNWYTRWIFAAHSSQIGEIGDYITVQIGHYPVIIVRNNEAQIVALNNSCRHRGARMCQREKGNSPNLVCPYHQWTYDLNGKLLYARNMMDELQLESLPLTSFETTECDGFVFVRLIEGEALFEHELAGLQQQLAESTLSSPDNWSCVAEYRQQQDTPWQQATPFQHSDAKCLHQGHNFSVWQAQDHSALIRVLPLSDGQTEVAIQCLVNAAAQAGRDYLDQALMEQWGITDYVAATEANSQVESQATAASQAEEKLPKPRQQQIASIDQQSKQQLEQHWYRQWIFAAHASQIPETGDYITLQIGHYPVIVLRNNEGDIVALNNSCRHRGARICQQDKGSAANLVCPYHQWTFDLNGQLIFARNMMDELDLDKLPLVNFEVVDQQGFIFVRLAKSDTAFGLAQAAFNQALADLPLANSGRWASAAEYRQLQDVSWQQAQLFAHSTAKCLFRGDNQSIWQAYDHLAIIRVIPITLEQTEIAIQCLVSSEAVAGRDYIDQALMEQWGITDYVSTSSTEAYAQLEESLQATQEFAEKYGLQAPSLGHDEMDYNDMFASHKAWDSALQELVCTVVVEETHNVRTFTFKAADGNWFKYKPGQFITLSIPTPDGSILRTYTISSTPSRPFSLSVTVKLQAGSLGTRWLFENVKPGTSVKAYGPAGEFSFFNQPADKYLLISAGSGITPMLSMTRWMFDYGNDMDVNFISCVQAPEDILFKEELENVARRCADFRLSWVCDDDKNNVWTGYRGRFNRLLLGLAAPDYMDRDVYCCGPAPFMKAVREALDASGFDMSRYFEESFGAPETPAATDALPNEAEVVQVSFGQSNKQLSCSQRETLLEAAKAADIPIPSACGFGVCGTCKVKVSSGESHMVHSGGISQKDIDAGYVLACCTNPISDIVIDI